MVEAMTSRQEKKKECIKLTEKQGDKPNKTFILCDFSCIHVSGQE